MLCTLTLTLTLKNFITMYIKLYAKNVNFFLYSAKNILVYECFLLFQSYMYKFHWITKHFFTNNINTFFCKIADGWTNWTTRSDKNIKAMTCFVQLFYLPFRDLNFWSLLLSFLQIHTTFNYRCKYIAHDKKKFLLFLHSPHTHATFTYLDLLFTHLFQQDKISTYDWCAESYIVIA